MSRSARLPAWALAALAAAAAALFALAWASFRYPLSYCDSPGWAPNYLGDLIGRAPPHAASPRGWPATAFLGGLGRLAAAFHFPGLIGLVQGALLLAAVLAAGRRAAAGAAPWALLLAPAFLASAMRHAVYGQTLLSEPLAVALAVGLAGAITGPRPGPRAAAAWGAAAAVLAAIRVDLAYFAPLLAARGFGWGGGTAERRRRLASLAAGMAAAALLVGAVERAVGRQDHPTGRILAIAEWTPLTFEPAHPLAAWLRTPLSDRLAAEHRARRFATFEEAMPLAREAAAAGLDGGWAGVARLVLYDAVNHPVAVARHRTAALHDLYASAYAAFWPGYRPRSAYYSRYDAVFPGWSVAELDQGRYSPCTYFAVAQREYFHASGVANEAACGLLLALHRAAWPYAAFVLRPLVWLALPAFVLLVARRRAGAELRWAAGILAAHFLLRALLVCADERYQLPVDLLTIAFAARVLPEAARALAEIRRGGASPA